MGVKLGLTLRKEHRLRVFLKWLLGVFGPKREAEREAGEDCVMRSFMTCTLRHVLLG